MCALQHSLALLEPVLLFVESVFAAIQLRGPLILFFSGKIVFGVEFRTLCQQFLSSGQFSRFSDGLRLALCVPEDVIAALIGSGLPGAFEKPESGGSDHQ